MPSLVLLPRVRRRGRRRLRAGRRRRRLALRRPRDASRRRARCRRPRSSTRALFTALRAAPQRPGARPAQGPGGARRLPGIGASHLRLGGKPALHRRLRRLAAHRGHALSGAAALGLGCAGRLQLAGGILTVDAARRIDVRSSRGWRYRPTRPRRRRAATTTSRSSPPAPTASCAIRFTWAGSPGLGARSDMTTGRLVFAAHQHRLSRGRRPVRGALAAAALRPVLRRLPPPGPLADRPRALLTPGAASGN